jgi:hypothetical protein
MLDSGRSVKSGLDESVLLAVFSNIGFNINTYFK